MSPGGKGPEGVDNGMVIIADRSENAGAAFPEGEQYH